MDVKDLRIGDYVRVCTRPDIYIVTEISNSMVTCSREGETCEINPMDVKGIVANKDILEEVVGAAYNDVTVEYILRLGKTLAVSIRPCASGELYTARIIGRYKSPYCNFSHIHILQHWLWDILKYDINS